MSYFREHFKDAIADEETLIFTDYEAQKEINFETGDEKAVDMTKSNVLGFKFKSGNQLFLRPSGTEPKIKFYTMVKEAVGTVPERKKKAEERIEVIESFIHKTINPL